jgi:hypothetical protein
MGCIRFKIPLCGECRDGFAWAHRAFYLLGAKPALHRSAAAVEALPYLAGEVALISWHAADLTSRCSQPLHRVQPDFPMIKTHSFQASPALVSGG